MAALEASLAAVSASDDKPKRKSSGAKEREKTKAA
jgi:hypothetical protein